MKNSYWILTLLLAACDTNLKVKSTGGMGTIDCASNPEDPTCAEKENGSNNAPAEIFIENSPTATNQVALKTAWRVDGDRLVEKIKFHVYVAQSVSCEDPITGLDVTGKLEGTLEGLSEGTYYLCLKADQEGQVLQAKNNGIKVVVDRTPPIIQDLPEKFVNAPFTLDPTVSDASDLTYTWEKLSGPGALNFSAEKSRETTFTPMQEGVYEVLLTAEDAAGNKGIKTYKFTYDITPPAFTSLVKSGEAGDGYINDAEKAATNALWTLTASDYATVSYSSPLDDSSNVTCDVTKTYDQPSIASAADMSSDAPWIICARLEDNAGNITYGKSEVITRDILPPTLASLNGANAANDGYINASEAGSGDEIVTLVASGNSSASYTNILDNTPAVNCNNTQTYGNSSIPAISSMPTSDDSYVVCVRLMDDAQNTAYGISQVIVRDAQIPTVSLNDPGEIHIANQASIVIGGNCSEDTRTVSIGGALSSTATCSSGSWSKTLDYTSVANGSVTITANHSDAAGNNATQASVTVTKDATMPTCGSVGDDCYSDSRATTTVGLAETPSGKSLTYTDTGSGFYVWKETSGNRVLNANGLDKWAMNLNLTGKEQSSTEFTAYSSIVGRACPPNVYIDDSNKFATGNCLYYTTEGSQSLSAAGTSQSDPATMGLTSWNNYNGGSAKWYVGNIKTCSDKGMRLPTYFETSTTTLSDPYYPTSDGNPVFAQANGIPANGGWTRTASSSTDYTDDYWLWNGTTSLSAYAHYFSGMVRCVLPSSLPTCGGSGDGCYDDAEALANEKAITPSGKYLEYITAAGGFKVWKEIGGNRVLQPNGLDEWQKKLNLDGKGFSATDFTDYASISGKVCPPHVYIADSYKFASQNCLYYTSEATQSLDAAGTSQTVDGSIGLGEWNSYNGGIAKWYVGNIQTCASKGMRLPTMFETTAATTNDANYPSGDGTPTFALTDGVPDNGGYSWTATASTDSINDYWRWSGMDIYNNNYWNNGGIRCVLPSDNPPVCGGAGDSCYSDSEAISYGKAQTPSGKKLEYVISSGTNYVWKEIGGNRVLKADGSDNWAMMLNPNGKGFSGTQFTSYTSIGGRRCPTNVYIDDTNKFATGRCLYYSTANASQDLNRDGSDGINGMTTWSTQTWYAGNTQVCSSLGMRLPTIYETATTATTHSSYPTTDGTPVFAQSTGVPSNAAYTWTATTAAISNTGYMLWYSTSGINPAAYNTSWTVRCVLP